MSFTRLFTRTDGEVPPLDGGQPQPSVLDLTEAQFDLIAGRVAQKLTAGVVGDQLHETVRRVVAEIAERLVREEIARVRAESERE